VLASEERRQFVAMVHAAEHFWNGGATQPAWDAGDIFNARYDGRSGGASTETDAYLTPLPKATGRVDGRITPTNKLHVATTGWQFPSVPPAAIGGILQRGSKTQAMRVELPRGSRTVWLVMGASHAAPAGSLVGEISIVTGKSRMVEPLLYGRDIAAIDDSLACTAGPVVQLLTSVDGGNLFLRGRVVSIPAGAQLIELRGGTSGSALLVYAIAVE
jgi:hypothetical protein